MNKLYLSKNLAFLGSLTLGVIAATGIATAPAQAAVIGEFEWGDATDNFFDDVFEGGETFNDFDVVFSPGGLADSFDTQGIFVNPPGPLEFADPGNPQILNSTPTTGVFTLVNDLGNTAEYVLAQDLIFTLSDASDNQGDVIVTFGAGAGFLAAKDFENGVIAGVDLEETTSVATVFIEGVGTFPADDFEGLPTNVTEILTFGVLEDAEFGEYGAETVVSTIEEQVPEPATILGLLTVGGLGLSLKRKKQS